MSILIDSSVWFAVANIRESRNATAKSLLDDLANEDRIVSDHIVTETWLLLNSRIHRYAAEQFWRQIRLGAARMEMVTPADLDAAWAIGEAFPDQDFSIVDRTSFALMERLRITRAASFDDHFAIYRYGPRRDRAFQVLR